MDSYGRVSAAYEHARQAFDAMEKAHRRGDYDGPEAEEFRSAVVEMHAVMSAFRQEVDSERAERARAATTSGPAG